MNRRLFAPVATLAFVLAACGGSMPPKTALEVIPTTIQSVDAGEITINREAAVFNDATGTDVAGELGIPDSVTEIDGLTPLDAARGQGHGFTIIVVRFDSKAGVYPTIESLRTYVPIEGIDPTPVAGDASWTYPSSLGFGWLNHEYWVTITGDTSSANPEADVAVAIRDAIDAEITRSHSH